MASCKRRMTINKRLLPVKATYFFTLAGVGSLLPYLSVYMKQVGLSAAESALVYGAMPFLGALVRPALGACADATRRHRAFLMACCVVSGVLHAGLLFVPHNNNGGGGVVVAGAGSGGGNGSGQDKGMISEVSGEGLSGSSEGTGTSLVSGGAGAREGVLGSSEATGILSEASLVSGRTLEGLSGVLEGASGGLSKSAVFELTCSENGAVVVVDEKCRRQSEGAQGEESLSNCSLADGGNGDEMCAVTCRELTCDRDSPDAATSTSKCNNTENNITFNTTHRALYHSVCSDSPLEYNRDDGNSVDKFTCPKQSELRCSVRCETSNLNWLKNLTCSEPVADADSDAGTETGEKFGKVFIMFFLIYLFAQIAFSPILNLVDAMTYVHLGEERNKWGQQRLWGTVGYVTFSLIATVYMDVFGTTGKKNYTAAFVMFGANHVLASLCVWGYRAPESAVSMTSSGVGRKLQDILKCPRLVCLLAVVFVTGMYQGVIETFLYWHLHTLGSSQLLFGLCTLTNCLPEILILSIAGRILRVLPHVPMMSLVFLAWIIRLFVTSVLTNPWYVLLSEPLHSITFGLMYAGASAYGSKVAPPAMQGTIQGLLSGLHFGFGKGIGSVTSGYVFERFGSVVMFQSYAVSAAVSLVLFLFASALISRYSPDTQRLHTEEVNVSPADSLKGEKSEVQESMLNGKDDVA